MIVIQTRTVHLIILLTVLVEGLGNYTDYLRVVNRDDYSEVIVMTTIS